MRQIETSIHPSPVSAAGFGCASLGSRIGEKEGRAALQNALAVGINWFDVAPSYGDGKAEAILGQFAADHPGSVRVCTKVGILAQKVGWKSMIRPLARKIVGKVPALRKFATRARSVERLPMTPQNIIDSVERSLVALKTERLDALLLHGAFIEEIENEGLRQTLTGLIAQGKVAAAGVASSVEAAERAANYPEVFSIVQFANNPFEPHAEQAWLKDWRTAGRLVITHSALGAHGALANLTAKLDRGGAAREALYAAGYAGETKKAAASFLVDYALATNRNGIALFSVMQQRHLDALMAGLKSDRDRNEMLTLGQLLAATG